MDRLSVRLARGWHAPCPYKPQWVAIRSLATLARTNRTVPQAGVPSVPEPFASGPAMMRSMQRDPRHYCGTGYTEDAEDQKECLERSA
jgi:hypothetical protein